MSKAAQSNNAEPDDPFETIVLEYYEPLFRFAMSLTRSEPDASDLTQQTFYIWTIKGNQLRDITKVKTWLFTTLHRQFINGQRRHGKFNHQNLDEVREQLPEISIVPEGQLDAPNVLSALSRVDEIYQAAVALFYLKECSYKEIAEILNVPIGTVKSRIARGIVQLKKILKLEEEPHTQVSDGERAAENSKSKYEEWDLSATWLPEQSGLI